MSSARAVIAVVVAASALAAMVSCMSENVRTATVVIDGDDGGPLNGFACLDSEGDAGLRECLRDCTAACFDACAEDLARARDAGTAPATLVADDDRCVHECAARLRGCLDGCFAARTDESSPPVAARANGKTVCVAIDFIRLGGELECRSRHLLDWCASRPDGCGVIDRRVKCVSGLEPVPVDGGLAAAQPILDANYAKLRAALTADLATVTRSAPDEWVIVRMLATTEDEASLADWRHIDLERVVGCAVSCPVLLATRDSIDLALDFGVRGTCDVTLVRACAALGTPLISTSIDELETR